jgi:hypothetical protein
MNEQALKDKIKNISKEYEVETVEVWTKLYLERFLCRVNASKYRNDFIFKGGFLLSNYIPLNRETKDLDFSSKESSVDFSFIQAAAHEICGISLDDHMSYEIISIEDIKKNSQYPGFQLTVKCLCFGKGRTNIFIDIGRGDVVDAYEVSFQLLKSHKGPLFENEIMIEAYPPEFIFAEKFESITKLGSQTSRMKDFYDIYWLIQSGILNKKDVHSAIKGTFTNRKTQIEIPLEFDNDELGSLQKLWKKFTRSKVTVKDKGHTPSEITEVISFMNAYLT